MIASLLRTGALDVPWPTRLADGTVIEGRLGINPICATKCPSQPCKSETSTLIGTRCSLGLTVYEGRVDDQIVRVFGVVGPQHREALPTHADFKRACKGRSVTAQDFAAWVSCLKELSTSIRQSQAQSLAEALEPLHDAMRLARDVQQLAERALGELLPSVGDRFESASPTQLSLAKTSALLVDTFDLLEVYLNPKAASFGQPRHVEIYKLLDKLAKIAFLARRQEQRPAVRLVGNTRRAYDVFESFKLLPLTLIDNAQKYSRPGADVTVQVSETGTSLEVCVISEGAVLSANEQRRIFERGFRGEAARKAHPGGMGLGLYIAQTVAQAHGSTIRVTSTPLGFEMGGIAQARNQFTFVVRNVHRSEPFGQ